MAESLGKAVLELVADPRPLKAGLAKSKADTEGFARSTASSLKDGIMKYGLPAAAALAVVGEGMHKLFDAGEKLQVAQDSLNTAIEHTGGDITTLRPQYDEVAKSAAQFGVTQTEATTALARATLLTGNASAAQRAYQEALVISKATGKDLNAVLVATSKAQDGNTGSLSRYGVQLEKNASGQDQFNAIMGRFGGQAEANTTAGEKLRANFSNLEANLGKALIPAFNAAITVLNKVVTFLESPAIPNAVDSVVGAFKDAYHWLSNTWSNVTHLLAQPFLSAWGIIKSAINMLIEGLDAIDVKFAGIKIPFGPTIGAFDWHPFHIKPLAEGGIVTSPTLALIGEAGPEAVMPLSGANMPGGGVTINVTCNGVVGSPRDVATKIGRELEDLKTRGLGFKLA